MKKILSGIAFAVAAICLTSSAATATTIACNDPSLNNVNVLNVGSCSLGGLLFSGFGVSPTPQSTVLLENSGTGFSSGTADLSFQITTSYNPGPPPVSADTILTYMVSGANITGVNNENGGQTNAIIEEKVCTNVFSAAGVCSGTLLADFTTGGNSTNSGTFAAQTTIYIFKDIQQNQGNAFISSFINSHETGVPEPASLSMMGLGLFGLGLIGRRKRKV